MGEIWVTEQGARLSLGPGRLIVSVEDRRLAECPISQVERVMLLGNIQVTTPAIQRMLSMGIALVYLHTDGTYCGRLVGNTTPHVALRRTQYDRQREPGFALHMAQQIVVAKLRNLRVLLQRHRRQGKPDLDEAIAGLERMEASAGRTRTLHALLGQEGSATALYFRGYRTLLPEPWQMVRRTRRPPTDPVNALLSLGYTLLGQQAVSAAEAAGLDPYAGFLHQDVYHRPSLALDLTEEFRAVIDGLVLHVCSHRVLELDDFRAGGEDERPVVLETEGLKRYIVAYRDRFARPILHPRLRERMPLWRFVHLQAQEIARCVREGDAGYRGCVFR